MIEYVKVQVVELVVEAVVVAVAVAGTVVAVVGDDEVVVVHDDDVHKHDGVNGEVDLMACYQWAKMKVNK